MMTVTQRKVFNSLRILYQENDEWPVTVRAIQEHLGIPSPETVHRILRNLERMGYVERHHKQGTRPARDYRELDSRRQLMRVDL